MKSNHNPVALVTGSAKRIGATITTALHQHGYNVAIHYRHSKSEASELASKLNQQRAHSAIIAQADFNEFHSYQHLIDQVASTWGRLDLLINNASEYFPNEIGATTLDEWDRLINSNLKAPYFISETAAAHLKPQQGSIINIIDINGLHPLKGYPVYSIAKAGLVMLTRSLARELGPAVRVNGIAPGITMWAKHDDIFSEQEKQQLLNRTILKRLVDPADIVNAILFLISQQSITGQVINIDAGRR